MNKLWALCLLAMASMGLTACGGSKGSSSAFPSASLISDGGGEKIANPPASETGPPTKIVAIPGGSGAVVALFPDGVAFYSPDGFNVGGGGSSVVANGSGNLKVVDIVPVGAGVDTLFSDGSVYFSPDGMNLSGGGSTRCCLLGCNQDSEPHCRERRRGCLVRRWRQRLLQPGRPQSRRRRRQRQYLQRRRHPFYRSCRSARGS